MLPTASPLYSAASLIIHTGGCNAACAIHQVPEHKNHNHCTGVEDRQNVRSNCPQRANVPLFSIQ